MKRSILVLALSMLLLAGCGGPPAAETTGPEPTTAPVQTTEPTPTPEPTPELKYVNPLTGEPTAEDLSGKRPIAIMLNNLKAALPQHGVSQADIIYEIPAEGGITRMLAVFQSVDGVGEIGSVRSARPYYVEIAQGLDAVLLHAGGSDDAYIYIKNNGITALDCVNGPYEGTLLWRDKDRLSRGVSREHTVFTSGEVITELFAGYTFRQEHREGYQYPQTFVEDGTPAGGTPAQVIEVDFSNYKTGVFRYDAEAKAYRVEEYGEDYIDGNTGHTVLVTNVLVLSTSMKTLDSEGRLRVDLSAGQGWYACGGAAVPIRWSKGDGDQPFTYTLEDGTPLSLGQGSSYVNIIASNRTVTFS